MIVLENPDSALRYECFANVFGRRMLVAAFVTRELADTYCASDHGF